MRPNMRSALWKLLLVLGSLFSITTFPTSPSFAQGGQIGPPNAIMCASYIASSFTTASAFTALPGQTGKGIYICGYSASTANTTSQTNFQLTYTTSSPTVACNTIAAGGASVAITPPHGVTSNAPLVDHQAFAFQQVPVVTSTVSPGTLCLVTTGTGASLQFILYYSQL